MERAKHWLIGPHLDLFAPDKQGIASRGLRDGVLSEDDLRTLCSAVLDYADRRRRVMKTLTKPSA